MLGGDFLRSGTDAPWRRISLIAGCILLAIVVAGGALLMLRPSSPSSGALAAANGASDTKATGKTGNGRGGLRLCNRTASQVGVAIGYKDQTVWTTSGWWNVPSNTCETIVAGPLVSRFYYIYAVDYDRGGAWKGPTIMCTRDKMFTIQGIEDCVARGYERTGFFEIDTGEQKNWTVQLTEGSQQGADAK
jgi:uncharacterized membrane protein